MAEAIPAALPQTAARAPGKIGALNGLAEHRRNPGAAIIGAKQLRRIHLHQRQLRLDFDARKQVIQIARHLDFPLSVPTSAAQWRQQQDGLRHGEINNQTRTAKIFDICL